MPVGKPAGARTVVATPPPGVQGSPLPRPAVINGAAAAFGSAVRLSRSWRRSASPVGHQAAQPAHHGSQTATAPRVGAGGASGRLDDAEDSQKDDDDEDGDDDVQDIQDLALLGPLCAEPVQPTKRIHARTVPAAPCHPRACGRGWGRLTGLNPPRTPVISRGPERRSHGLNPPPKGRVTRRQRRPNAPPQTTGRPRRTTEGRAATGNAGQRQGTNALARVDLRRTTAGGGAPRLVPI